MTSLRSARRTTAVLLALTLLAVACGSRVEGSVIDPDAAAATPPATSPDEPTAAPEVSADAEPEEPGPVEDPAPVRERRQPAEPASPDPAAQEAAAEKAAAEKAAAEKAERTDAETSGRQVADNAWTPFAAVDGVVLHHPSARVERVGFHESNHEGARQLEILDGAVAAMTLETRGRAAGSRSAADVVVAPDVEVRAPVTGTVLRAGTYVLYCDYSDDYVVVEPEARPGWEVKLLHIDGVQVTQGQSVVAGETVLAPRPTPLPFDSQVDEHTAEPSWPHVHIEVVDPSIPNESSGGGC